MKIKQDVEHLKQSTSSIIDAKSKLSTQVEKCIGEINAVISVNRKISNNDSRISEAIENLSDKSNTMKNYFDQKSNQILNKTSTIVDKLNKNTEAMKMSKPPTNATSATPQTHTNNDKTDNSPKEAKQPRWVPNKTINQQSEHSKSKDKRKEVIPSTNQQSAKQNTKTD